MMNMELFNPFVRKIEKRPELYTGLYDCKAYDYRVFFIKKGSTYLTVDGKTQLLKENEMAILPPNMAYSSEMQSEVEAYVINMDLCFENTDAEMVVADYVHLFKPDKIMSKTLWGVFPAFYRCPPNTYVQFQNILDIYIEKQAFYHERIAAMLKALIIESMLYTNYDRTPDLVKKVRRFLEENNGRDITNQEIGDAFSYHPNYINRIFKEATGETVHHYLNETRLKKALKMILESDITIEQIGKECGFSSCAYFIKRFREKYGASPFKYRGKSRA